MGDDLNSYKKLAERLANKWRADMSSKLQLDPQIKKLLDEMEELNEKKQPTADDKKKAAKIELDIKKLGEQKMAQSARKLESDINDLPKPEGEEPEKIRTIHSDLMEDMEMDGLALGKRLKLGLDVDCNDSPGDCKLFRLQIRFGKKR
jgi:hypothetical protein